MAGLATVWRAISPEKASWGIRGSAKTERYTPVKCSVSVGAVYSTQVE